MSHHERQAHRLHGWALATWPGVPLSKTLKVRSHKKVKVVEGLPPKKAYKARPAYRATACLRDHQKRLVEKQRLQEQAAYRGHLKCVCEYLYEAFPKPICQPFAKVVLKQH